MKYQLITCKLPVLFSSVINSVILYHYDITATAVK